LTVACDVQGGSGSDGSHGSQGEQASCCDPAAPCEVPCGRLTEFWDPQLLLELSHHPAIERCHALGGHRLKETARAECNTSACIRASGRLGMSRNCVLNKVLANAPAVG
jgi:hypothetical protein